MGPSPHVRRETTRPGPKRPGREQASRKHQSELVLEPTPVRPSKWVKIFPKFRDEQKHISLSCHHLDHQSELGFEIFVGAGCAVVLLPPPPKKKNVHFIGKKNGSLFYHEKKKKTSWGLKTRASSFESPQVLDRITTSKMPKSTGIYVQMVLTMQA